MYRQELQAAGIILSAALFTAGAARADDPALISFSIRHFDQGWIDPEVAFLDLSTDQREEAVDFRIEYRFGMSLLSIMEPYASLRPFIGLEATSDATVYGLGGFLLDIPLGPFFLAPSLGAGLYFEGNGKDLGSVIEFRSQLEAGYRFANDMRISVAYSHISNAGISDTNPGANVIGLYFHMPAAILFGR